MSAFYSLSCWSYETYMAEGRILKWNKPKTLVMYGSIRDQTRSSAVQCSNIAWLQEHFMMTKYGDFQVGLLLLLSLLSCLALTLYRAGTYGRRATP